MPLSLPIWWLLKSWGAWSIMDHIFTILVTTQNLVVLCLGLKRNLFILSLSKSRVHKKASQKNFFIVTLKVASRNSSHLACSVNDHYLAMWHKIIHFKSRIYAHYLVKLWVSVVVKMLLLAKTRGLGWKQFSVCYKHIICLRCYYERVQLFWTRCINYRVYHSI